MQLVQIIQKIKSLTTDEIMSRWNTPLQELSDKIEFEKFYLVVVGLFKRGKSSIINALLEAKLAPVAVTPVTAIITLFDYSETPHAEVYFENGVILQIDISAIDQYVSEEENAENQKKVKLVKVFYNSDLLKTTLIVDTPGLGSSFEHNSATTLGFIPKIDAALFVLSADIPISKIDLELLDSFQQSAPKFFFVLNKADLLLPADLEKIIDHNKKVLAGKLNKKIDDIVLRVISTKDPQNTKISLEKLSEDIRKFIGKEKGQLLIGNVSRNVKSILKGMDMELRLRIDAWMMPVAELENRKLHFTTSLSLMQKQKEDFEIVMAGKIKRLQEWIGQEVNQKAKQADKEVNQQLHSILLTGNKPITTELENQKSKIEAYILTEFHLLKDDLEILVKNNFKSALQDYISRSRSFLNEMATNLKALMGVDFDVITNNFDLDVYTTFYLNLDSGMENISMPKPFGYRLLPERAWRKKLYRKWYAHYHEIIIRNSSSVGYDLQYKVQESFRLFNYDLHIKLQQLLQQIETILQETLEQKMKVQTDYKKKTAPLEHLLQQINQLDKKLTALSIANSTYTTL